MSQPAFASVRPSEGAGSSRQEINASSRMPAALRAFLADVSLFVNHQLKTYCPVKRTSMQYRFVRH
jgi:hypothetical protein